jgi:hypothetical protein
LAVGFSVDELAKILGARDHGLSPCREVRQLAGGKLEALGSRIRELQHLRTALRKTIDDWDHRLAKTPSGGRAALLESLAAAQPSAARQLSPLLAPALRASSMSTLFNKVKQMTGKHSRSKACHWSGRLVFQCL